MRPPEESGNAAVTLENLITFKRHEEKLLVRNGLAFTSHQPVDVKQLLHVSAKLWAVGSKNTHLFDLSERPPVKVVASDVKVLTESNKIFATINI